MAWDKGFNFRATAGYVTDGANETYALNEVYPITRNGVTFGWSNTAGGDEDENNTVDRRLAGVCSRANTPSQGTFRVDLPAAGDYVIRIANGDVTFSQLYQYFQILDDSTVLVTRADTDGTVGGHFNDATGADHTTAAWPDSNTSITLTFATTIFNLTLGSPDAQANASTIAHVFISQVAAPAQVALDNDGVLWESGKPGPVVQVQM